MSTKTRQASALRASPNPERAPRRRARSRARIQGKIVPSIPADHPAPLAAPNFLGQHISISPEVPIATGGGLSLTERFLGTILSDAPSGPMSATEAVGWINSRIDTLILDALRPVKLFDFSVFFAERKFEDEIPKDKSDVGCIIRVDTQGEIDWGWIADDAIPLEWRRHAYSAICNYLPKIVAVAGFDDILEDLACMYWDGSTNDDEAIEALKDHYEEEDFDLDDHILPSQILAKRPDWIIPSHERPLTSLRALPPTLRRSIMRLKAADRELRRQSQDTSMWMFAWDDLVEFAPDYESVASLPSISLIPIDTFRREVDAAFQAGMEIGFSDICGVASLHNRDDFETLLHEMKLGVAVLIAVQDILSLKMDTSTCTM